MTEAEWRACTDPKPLLEFVQVKTNDRKLRLFACACCRRIWHLLNNYEVEEAVVLSEHVADGSSELDRLQVILRQLQETAKGYAPATMAFQGTMGVILTTWAAVGQPIFALGLYSLANAVAWNADPSATVIEDDWSSPRDPCWRETWAVERKAQASLVRDIFSNPFRPIAIELPLLTPAIVGLAQSIYDDRAFDRLPNLADALEEAGCTNAEILKHCRSKGPHVRGCWVVDLLLGKE